MLNCHLPYPNLFDHASRSQNLDICYTVSLLQIVFKAYIIYIRGDLSAHPKLEQTLIGMVRGCTADGMPSSSNHSSHFRHSILKVFKRGECMFVRGFLCLLRKTIDKPSCFGTQWLFWQSAFHVDEKSFPIQNSHTTQATHINYLIYLCIWSKWHQQFQPHKSN